MSAGAWLYCGSLASAGPGSDLSEEPASGFQPVALDYVDAPTCPPGPAAVVGTDPCPPMPRTCGGCGGRWVDPGRGRPADGIDPSALKRVEAGAELPPDPKAMARVYGLTAATWRQWYGGAGAEALYAVGQP